MSSCSSMSAVVKLIQHHNQYSKSVLSRKASTHRYLTHQKKIDNRCISFFVTRATSTTTTTPQQKQHLPFIKFSASASSKENHQCQVVRYFKTATDQSSNPAADLRDYFHIEASNALRDDATALTVTGPDIDGMLASMTIALATRGCSLVELHAAKDEDVSFDRVWDYDSDDDPENANNNHQIRDIFYVVNRTTNEQFEDDQLEELALGLLESLRSPMALVSGFVGHGSSNTNKTDDHLKDRLEGIEPYQSLRDQIAIIPSTAK